MKVTLTVNICIYDNLANGTQGIIRQIVYDENSINIFPNKKNNFMLNKPPKYVIVELLNSTTGSYKDLPPNHVLIYPIKRECTYTAYKCDGTTLQKRFQRLQLPLTPAYAFTDYKCQGRTLNKVIIDLTSNESILNLKLPSTLQDEIDRLNKCAQTTAHLEQWPDD
ncbi:17085_t:CDS:2 [Cetraspora pellucida]|uniref:17085_t:CDS:1 n=1 Tax=Cetraspora pellucida TaxID=1433469 RepID=A0A9N9E257_9GLOM|nr:17085_t:CDS:2 [Cetraspora pellucida]